MTSPALPPELPYGRQLIEDDDIAAVVEVLRSDRLTQGPRTGAFEAAVADGVGAKEAVACASGTAALHLALRGLDVGPGDLCAVPAITFLSTATAVRMCGADVAFTDVDPATGLMRASDLEAAAARAGRLVKVALPVHLGGRLCDMAALAHTAAGIGAALVEDGAHALGSRGPGGTVGACRHSAATTFSFHPVKTIACGEGGMVTLNDPERAERLRRLRNHGVTRDLGLITDRSLSLDAAGQVHPWSYEQLELGYNYRMTDLEAALGLSQFRKLGRFRARRSALAQAYDRRLAPLAPGIQPLAGQDGETCLHLYGVRIDFPALGVGRDAVMRAMARQGVQTQVHYIPVYRQPYFTGLYGAHSLPGAEAYYARALSLPLFPAMADADIDRAVGALAQAIML